MVLMTSFAARRRLLSVATSAAAKHATSPCVSASSKSASPSSSRFSAASGRCRRSLRFLSDAPKSKTTAGGGGAKTAVAEGTQPQQQQQQRSLLIRGSRPKRREVSAEERAALRAARKERAAKFMQEQRQHQGHQQGGAAAADGSGQATAGGGGGTRSLAYTNWAWYMAVAVPSAILVWGINDEDSPPAKFSEMIGLTGLITGFTDQIAKPSHDKLLPDWSQMPNVPQDIPVPHTLVLDLENTLVNATWDRKYGWRHAKRPGVDKFLHEMAQYYEIVLYSPSIDSIAEPVVTQLDRDGCILHRLYRDATYFYDGVHVKDLKRLNRNVKRMIVIDDDPLEVQFDPDNLIRVKPYTDPTDLSDDTLERITPFLIEVARDGHDDIPALLRQYRGMDADEIADEQDRRIEQLRSDRDKRSRRGLGALARGAKSALPAPELPAAGDAKFYGSSSSSSSAPQQLTAKDIAGAAPGTAPEDQDGITGWMNRRAKEKEEHQMRKMEKWNEVMMKKQKEKREKEQQAAAATGRAM